MGKVGDQVVRLEEPAYNEEAFAALSAMSPEDVTPGTPATEWPDTEVTIALNTEFQSAAPTVVEFLGNYGTVAAEISKALAYMQDESASAQEAAVWWMQNNDGLASRHPRLKASR